MRKRWVVIVITISAVGLAVFWLHQTRIVGWLRGEVFYQGRPTSYWAAEIARWECTKRPWIRGGMGVKEYHRHPCLPPLLARCIPFSEPIWPSLFDGDPAGLDVLNELVEHPSETVSEWAEEGIDRMTTGKKGPSMAVTHFGRLGTLTFPIHLGPDQVHGGIGP